MPEITRFYGVIIRMYYKDHVPPHIHASYGEMEALVSVETGEVIDGRLPRTARRLVREWVCQHTAQLQEMWESQDIMELPPLE